MRNEGFYRLRNTVMMDWIYAHTGGTRNTYETSYGKFLRNLSCGRLEIVH
jgi:hypothetical protein